MDWYLRDGVWWTRQIRGSRKTRRRGGDCGGDGVAVASGFPSSCCLRCALLRVLRGEGKKINPQFFLTRDVFNLAPVRRMATAKRETQGWKAFEFPWKVETRRASDVRTRDATGDAIGTRVPTAADGWTPSRLLAGRCCCGSGSGRAPPLPRAHAARTGRLWRRRRTLCHEGFARCFLFLRGVVVCVGG